MKIHLIDGTYELFRHYFALPSTRDKDGREVDFVTVIDGKVVDLIEVKASDGQISSSLKYYKKILNPKRAVQIVGEIHRPFDSDDIRVTDPIHFFTDPPWEDKT